MEYNAHHDGDETPQSQALRAEKKRYSDRVAQQRHRQRRKEYITDLEEQLRLLKDGGESQMAQLVSENARLRQELERANSMLNSIRDLLGQKLDPPSSTSTSLLPVTETRESVAPAIAAPADESLTVDDEAPLILEAVVTTTDAPSAIARVSMSPGGDLMSTEEQTFGNMIHSSASTSSSPQTVLPEYATTSEPNADQPAHGFAVPGHVLEQVTSWWMDPTVESQRSQYYDSGSRGQRPDTIPTPWPFAAEGIPNQRPIPSSEPRLDDRRPMYSRSPAYGDPQPSQSRHRSPLASSASSMTLGNLVDLLGQSDSRQWDELFASLSTVNLTRHYYSIPPRIVLPPPARDSSMHQILHVARAHIGDLGSPTFRDFLLKDTPNPLSREIKLFADPMRKMNKASEYLAVYWVLYLLFRWQAALDEASYQEMPSWLRPTQLQLEVEHHFLFDQVPWPDLREELIKLSLNDMERAFDALMDIGRHLIVNIYTAYEWSGSNLQQLKLDIANIGRWKLDSLFFRKYPQWAWTAAR